MHPPFNLLDPLLMGSPYRRPGEEEPEDLYNDPSIFSTQTAPMLLGPAPAAAGPSAIRNLLGRAGPRLTDMLNRSGLRSLPPIEAARLPPGAGAPPGFAPRVPGVLTAPESPLAGLRQAQALRPPQTTPPWQAGQQVSGAGRGIPGFEGTQAAWGPPTQVVPQTQAAWGPPTQMVPNAGLTQISAPPTQMPWSPVARTALGASGVAAGAAGLAGATQYEPLRRLMESSLQARRQPVGAVAPPPPTLEPYEVVPDVGDNPSTLSQSTAAPGVVNQPVRQPDEGNGMTQSSDYGNPPLRRPGAKSEYHPQGRPQSPFEKPVSAYSFDDYADEDQKQLMRQKMQQLQKTGVGFHEARFRALTNPYAPTY